MTLSPPKFDMAGLRPLPGFESAAPRKAKKEAVVDMGVEIPEGLAMRRTAQRRTTLDLTRVSNASKHIGQLPTWGETIHAVMKGNYNAWDLIPAILALAAPAVCAELYVATLGFNERNANELLAMIDAGTVKRVVFVCSCYFQATTAGVFKHMADGLAARGQKIKAIRNHAKLQLLRLTSGDDIVVESSANLRSCRNIEVFSMTNDSTLYDFHKGWIDSVMEEVPDAGT